MVSATLVSGARTTTARRKRAIPAWAVPLGMLSPIILATAVVIVFPVLFVVVESFFDVNPAKHQGWEWVGLDNYARIFADPELGGVLINSLVWTFGSVLLQFVVAFAAALLVRGALQGRAWAWLRALYILPWATPIIVGALSWRWLYHPQYGMLNDVLTAVGLGELALPWLSDPRTALAAVMITNVWRGFPFIMIMLLSGMASIPDDIYEAADVDGASPTQKMWRITLPLLRPMILLSTLMSLIWTFNNFGLIFVMTGGGPAGASDILTTYVYKNAFERFDFGYAAALSVFLFVIVAAGSALYVKAMGKDALK
jgi:multiple sugar transport system permease protein